MRVLGQATAGFERRFSALQADLFGQILLMNYNIYHIAGLNYPVVALTHIVETQRVSCELIATLAGKYLYESD